MQNVRCESEKKCGAINTHGLGPQMNLPFDEDHVCIHVVIVVLETSYRRTGRNLFDGTNDSLVKLPYTTREGVREIDEGEVFD